MQKGWRYEPPNLALVDQEVGFYTQQGYIWVDELQTEDDHVYGDQCVRKESGRRARRLWQVVCVMWGGDPIVRRGQFLERCMSS